ncbi:hypothetical protein JB92DRAFT_1831488 [Gautieria morchelliformis]|nr:hypothetical protein JB92DRAFT_1831488 [Gautieria morchelliformis]
MSTLSQVTGGTGFLGAHIVQQLLDAGYRVRCTANPLKSRFLEAAHLHLVRAGQLEVVQVRDLATESLDRALVGITAVIHTAFPAPGSMEGTELLLNATSSTTSLLRQAYEHGIRKFVLTSSYLAMVGAGVSEGDAQGQGQGQHQGQGQSGQGQAKRGVWTEYTFSDQDWTQASYDAVFSGSDDPAWAYAAAKTLTEAAAWDFAGARPDFDLATVLPTLLLGPFAPGHAILSTYDLSTNVLLHAMLASGAPPHPVWPYFVDVRDAASAHVKALEAPRLGREPCVRSRATDPSHSEPESESGSRSGAAGQASGVSPGSRPTDLPIPLASSNPSLVDLGSTLEKLELSYRSTPGTPMSVSHPSYDYPNSGTTGGPVDIAYAYPAGSLSPASPSPSASHIQARAPRKRFVAAGTSFTWPDAIAHLRAARPDLARALPDAQTCLPMPERVAALDGRWSGSGSGAAFACASAGAGGGAAHSERGAAGDGSDSAHVESAGSETGGREVPAWDGLGMRWRDWRETVEDAVADLERVAASGRLEESGWEDLLGSDDSGGMATPTVCETDGTSK